MPLTLLQFTEKYPPRAPRKPPDADDQLRLLTVEDGVVLLTGATYPEPVSGKHGFAQGCHLWVMMSQTLPVVLETAPRVRPPVLSSGKAKHTNLTGGQPACCGGELWVDSVDPGLLYVNGGSGRYRPQSPAQLADAI